MGKKEIRAEVKKRRAEAELGTLHENSKKIVETFVSLPQYQNTDLLLAMWMPSGRLRPVF